jgi:3-oxoacyl-[acyl-carrier protein] reductase
VNLGLEGCVAVVGGSSSGMGRATAEALAAEGCHVVLFARRGDVLEEAAQEIEGRGEGRALAIPGDATDPASLDRAIDATLDRFGRLDVVVNNTGGPPAGGFEQFGDDDWQAAYELTVLSALRLTRRALPALRDSGRGRVVNITSSAVKEPNEGLLLSNALRPAIIGWTRGRTASPSTTSRPATSTRAVLRTSTRWETIQRETASATSRQSRSGGSAAPAR